MRTDWRNWMPSHHFFNERRHVGQRRFVPKVGKPPRPHDAVYLPLCSALRVRVKDHREKEREKRCDRLSEQWLLSRSQRRCEDLPYRLHQCTLLQGQLLTSIHPRAMTPHKGLLSWMPRRTGPRYQLPRRYRQYTKYDFEADRASAQEHPLPSDMVC